MSSQERTPTSSGATTPTTSSSSYLPSLTYAVSGFLHRLSSDQPAKKARPHSLQHSATSPVQSKTSSTMNGVYTPPRRNASPFQPPPLYPVNLRGYLASTAQSAQLLSRSIAEEIRLLVPPRLQLCEEWNLVYSLEQDGVSLGTLYKKCDGLRGFRNGFVLVVKDGDGGLFGAYLTEAPHVSPHYFGTGECFLWRASVLSRDPNHLHNLPPPPSTDTTHLQRSTTIGVAHANSSASSLVPPTPAFSHTGASTPERIRFKAFPYSGVNDYMMLCEPSFLSVGGGDGHYGLWLDDTFEKGISSPCLTFGNEPLSEEGEKFDILGVEIWTIGNT
ncbi:MAG: oxidation resistance protein 1 [Claussenomyces sp. TS43310]|nr:MAG: oxidation resistance protein 1 [Claussenomyces sp. TS43310]